MLRDVIALEQQCADRAACRPRRAGPERPGRQRVPPGGQFWTLTYRDRTIRRTGDLGELLDARARAEYCRRVAELETELAELSAALGVGGRPRRSGDPAERVRRAVRARIRLTIGRIDREHAERARHLTNSVHTGMFCVYRPEHLVDWSL